MNELEELHTLIIKTLATKDNDAITNLTVDIMDELKFIMREGDVWFNCPMDDYHLCWRCFDD